MKNPRFQLKLRNSLSIALISILFMSCNSETQIDIQGHRGCRGLFPENSLPAFEKAIDLGVTTLELDLAITKDHKVVVSHEPYMNSVICFDPEGNTIDASMERKYNLHQMTHEEIKQFDCGSKVHSNYPNQKKLKTYKPLLAEVFKLVKSKNSDVRFNIEIKSQPEYYGIYTPQPKAYVKLVLEEIKKHDMLSRANLQSFDLEILEEIDKQDPNMKVALLVDGNETIEDKLKALSFIPEIISPYFKLLTSEKVKDYKARGFEVIPWTINKVTDMKQLIAWNVDGIITDYPDRLIDLVKN
jgi:glycerophosphoryl diester phosphodiesterase